MSKDLELVETRALVDELLNRHDVALILLRKDKDHQGDRQTCAVFHCGPIEEVLGFSRLNEHALCNHYFERQAHNKRDLKEGEATDDI